MIQFELNLYSKYRTELMGWATIMVVVSHLYMSGVELSEPVRRITGIGASGVELFLFLSGFGLWKSYSSVTSGLCNIDIRKIGKWYEKRYLRILVPYLIFAIPVYGILTAMDHLSVSEFIKRVSFISFWTQGWGVWYIVMLIPLYLLTPFLICMLTGEGKVMWLIILVLAVELFAYFAFYGEGDVFFSRFIVQRLPSFFIGIFMARSICEGKKVSQWWVLLVPLVAYVLLWGMNHTIGTRFFYLWLLPLPISTIMVWLLMRYSWLQSICKFMGTISLEMYCTHMFIPVMIVRALSLSPSFSMYFLGVVISIGLSVGINSISVKTIDRLMCMSRRTV